MSHGPGRLQRRILEFMQRMALSQRTSQRRHWQIEPLAMNFFRGDAGWSSLTARQRADARKQVRRACDSLVLAGHLQKVGFGWALPPETPAEAGVRRKRNHTTEAELQRGKDRKWSERGSRASDRDIRRKLGKILGLLSSTHDAEVLAAARQAERLRGELGCSWNELIGR
jgi:hypothetical protein